MSEAEVVTTSALHPAPPAALLPDAALPPVLAPGNPYEPELRAAMAALDREAIAAEFGAQDQLVYIERFVPPALVQAMVADVRRVQGRQHRTFVPFFRKGGAVGQEVLAREAPGLAALYWSPSVLAFVSELAQVALSRKSPRDAHAAALYLYQKKGDHVAWHYDDCGCDATVSYTAIAGVVNDTQRSQIQFQLFRKDRARATRALSVSTAPGSLVFFCGTKAYHRVSRLGRSEERVSFSMSYVRSGRRVAPWDRFQENLKDAVLYFGPRALFQRNYDR